MPDHPSRLQHRTPDWVGAEPLFHVRIRVQPKTALPLTDPRLSSDLLAAARRYHSLGHWQCLLFLLMPDHLHALLRISRHPGVAVVVQNWKRGTTRFQQVKWQENFFDHRIRHDHEATEKWRYILRNPVVNGLCGASEEWPHGWSCAAPEAAWGHAAPPVERADPSAL
jgi:putative transposase